MNTHPDIIKGFNLPAILLIILGLTNISNSFAQSSSDSVPSRSSQFPEAQQRQRLLDSQAIITPGQGRADAASVKSDSVRALINLFYQDQFRNFLDPEVPYFMMMTKNAKLAMGMGGVLKIRGIYDWNGAVGSQDFTPYYIPIPKDPTQMHKLSGSASKSVIYLTVLGRNTAIGDFKAYIEGGFSGYNHIDFKLKKAYLTVRDFTAGLAPSTFCDGAAETPVVDGGSNNGRIDRANLLFRYIHQFNKGWTLAASLEFPSNAITDQDPNTKACADYIPDFVAFGQYHWDDGYSHVRLSGLLRTLEYRDLMTQQNHHKLGWGVMLSSSVKVIPNLSLYGIMVYGAGHASYTGDLGGDNLDLIAHPGNPGELYAPSAFSFDFGLKYYFAKTLYATLGYSQMRTYLKPGAAATDYKLGQSGCANFFWDVTPRLTVGCEYLIGRRVNYDGTSGVSDRFEAMLSLSF